MNSVLAPEFSYALLIITAKWFLYAQAFLYSIMLYYLIVHRCKYKNSFANSIGLRTICCLCNKKRVQRVFAVVIRLAVPGYRHWENTFPSPTNLKKPPNLGSGPHNPPHPRSGIPPPDRGFLADSGFAIAACPSPGRLRSAARMRFQQLIVLCLVPACVAVQCGYGADSLLLPSLRQNAEQRTPLLRALKKDCSLLTDRRCVAPTLRLYGGGNTLGVDGEAITEEQAGEELIKATTQNNIEGLDPAGINLLVQSGAPVNYQDMWKRTPLHYAARSACVASAGRGPVLTLGIRDGHLLAAKRLVELGGDLTAQDFLG